MSCQNPLCHFPHDGGPELVRVIEATMRMARTLRVLAHASDEDALYAAMLPAVVVLYNLGWLDAERSAFPTAEHLN